MEDEYDQDYIDQMNAHNLYAKVVIKNDFYFEIPKSKQGNKQ